MEMAWKDKSLEMVVLRDAKKAWWLPSSAVWVISAAEQNFGPGVNGNWEQISNKIRGSNVL